MVLPTVQCMPEQDGLDHSNHLGHFNFLWEYAKIRITRPTFVRLYNKPSNIAITVIISI